MTATLIDSVRTHAMATPTRLAVGCAESGRRWTWAQLDAGVDRLAAWLVETLGWTSFFWLCAALAVPGMLLLLKVAPWNLQHGEAKPVA